MGGNALRSQISRTVALLPVLAMAHQLSAGTLTGNAWVEMVKGRPAGGHVALYEWNIYLSKDGGGVSGQQFRVGLPPNPSQAYYTFTSSSGGYTLFLDQPLFFGRPAVFNGITMPPIGTITLDVQPPTDYSCAFGTKSDPWGSNPWTGFSATWYQTFIATGNSITGIDFKLAGTNTSKVAISIHADPGNGSNVSTWPQVGSTRTVNNVGSLKDNWIRYRSGAIPTTAGQRYALKLAGVGGSPNSEFSIFRRIEDGNGYAGGQAFNAAGTGQNFDLYAIVFSDNDGTVVPYCSLEYEQGELAGWAGVWTQQIQAMGNGLAGAVFYYAGGDTWDKEFTFKVRSGSVNGTQVGPAKNGRGAYQASSNGLAAVSWAPGEVPLTPGQVYYLEISHPSGFNPARFTQPENAYAPGHAWQSYGAQPGVDLLMQVVEYSGQAAVPPSIIRTPASFNRTVPRGENLASDSFALSNGGGGLLSYSLTGSAGWLAPAPATGQATTETDNIAIQYNTSNLVMGPYSGTITITAPGASNTPQVVTVNLQVGPPLYAAADLDRDNDVDLDDFGKLQRCYSGAGVVQNAPDCIVARIDADEDVDLDDMNLMLGCLSGAGVQADTLCAE